MPTPQISTFDQLRAFIDNQLPDNISGLVDPADVRTALRSFVDIQSLRNDMMAADLSPDQAAAWNALINKLDQIQQNAASGIKGNATQANAPTPYDAVTYPNGLFETYQVRTPLTMPNSWGAAVTQAELDANYVFFDVKNGVSTKVLSLKLGVNADTVKYTGKNLANPALRVTGKWINSAGDVATLAGWEMIQHVPVTPNIFIVVSGYDGTGVSKYVVFEDVDKVKISAPANALTGTKKEFKTPINCHYISMSIKNTANVSPTELQIEEGGNPTTYEPYSETNVVNKINTNKILASYFQPFVSGATYKKNEVVYSGGKIYLSKINSNTALLTDVTSWENIGGGSGSTYDQTLNKADDVQFNKITANEVVIPGTLKKGTLASLPVGLTSSEYWLDTTDSATNPILRQKQ